MSRETRRRATVYLVSTVMLALVAGPAFAQDEATPSGPGAIEVEDDSPDSCGQGPGVPAEVAALCGVSGEVQVPVVHTQVSLLDAAAMAFWRQLVEWFAGGLHMLLDALVSAANTTTRVDLTASWFADQFGRLIRIGGAVMLPLFLAAMIRGLLMDRAELTRSVTMLPAATLLTVVALPAGQLFVATIDGLSAGYEAGLGSSVDKLVTLLGAAAEPLATPLAASGTAAGGGAFGFVLVSVFLIFAAFVVWLELVLRQAGIYLLVLFLPLAFAGLVWTPTRPWLGRMLQAFAALVISKFVIVVVLSTAAAALGAMAADWLPGTNLATADAAAVEPLLASASPFEQLSLLTLGVALIGLAAFAPYTVWRLIPLAAAHGGSGLEGVLRRGTAAVGRPHPLTTSYNTVASYDRAKLLKDRITPGGTSSLAPGGRPGSSPSAGPSPTPTTGGAAGGGSAGVVGAAAVVAARHSGARVGGAARGLADRTEASS
jgi:hypothetical protein